MSHRMAASVLALSAYFVVWAVAHSLLASLPVKRWARRAFGAGSDRWYRLAFNAIAAITVLPVPAMLTLLPDRTLYVVPSPWRWWMVGGQVLALAALFGTLLQTSVLHFLGVSQWFARQPDQSGALQIRGLYCYVRHPLYLFSLLLIWLTPTLTVNLLTLYFWITVYFDVGSLHEEKRLLAEYGAAYQDYRQRVPRLIPRLRRCYPPTEEDA
jgi:protein-S-isoprenylcysteine O-methyltransferase Ste14